MIEPAGRSDRVLAEAIRELPDGLVARPSGPSDIEAITELLRACDLAACGHTSTNVDEVRSELSDPSCRWAAGSATVWRDDALVGVLNVFDDLGEGGGWLTDAYVRPGEPGERALQEALARAALDEGRTRWALLEAAGGAAAGKPAEAPLAKAGCLAGDTMVREVLDALGFAEVRRFWRMRIDHPGSLDPGSSDPGSSDPGSSGRAGAPPGSKPPDGYSVRAFDSGDDDWHTLHRVATAAFLDHFDFTPLDFPTWREHLGGPIEDVSQWLFIEHEGEAVGYARGSDRYRVEGCGYVASIGVLRDHRGRGLAAALLRERFADDARRGRVATLLHVDSESPTGATRLYESAGMTADTEIVWLCRPLLD